MADLHYREGGTSGPRLLLLHGLGATCEVWDAITPLIDRRWLAPDLRGHGRSPHAAPYSHGADAAAIASLLGQDEEVTVIAHSMGGYIGMALASGLFGVRVAKVIAVGAKMSWSDEEIASMHALARKPARSFDTREEAVAWYLKVSGLHGIIDIDSPVALSGVTQREGKWTLAADPMTYGAVGPQPEPLVAAMLCPLRLGRGANDEMVDAASLTPFEAAPFVIAGAGHNAHVEQPAEFWRLVQPELA
jgi:pimeloyl-ACP methyl ester carboxylesterase